MKSEEEIGLSRLLMAIMENYEGTVIPPLSDFSPQLQINSITENGSSSSKKAKNSKMEERHRRDKMNNNYFILQSLIPNLRPKASMTEIVTRTTDYIQKLGRERDRLEELKKSLIMAESIAAETKLSRCIYRNSSVDVSFSGGVSFFGIQSPVRRGLVIQIFEVFEKNKAQILAANVLVNEEEQLMMTVTALAGGEGTIENIKIEILSL